MTREHDQVEEHDVAVAVDEEAQLCPEHHRSKQHHAQLEHDEASELRGRGRTNGEPGLGELVDLRRQRAHLHGREVAKEVARGLHRHEVADANRRVMVEVDRRDVGERAQHEVHADAHERAHEPAHLKVLERGHELLDLAGEEQERHVRAKDEADELSTPGGLLLVRVGSLFLLAGYVLAEAGACANARGAGDAWLGGTGLVRCLRTVLGRRTACRHGCGGRTVSRSGCDGLGRSHSGSRRASRRGCRALRVVGGQAIGPGCHRYGSASRR